MSWVTFVYCPKTSQLPVPSPKINMAAPQVKKRSNITINVGLDEDKMPIELQWKASDNKGPSEACKGVLLSLFNEQSKETMKIDLWTKDMQVVEMDRFMYQTLRGLADTYFRATGNKELANQMQQFTFYFGQATGAIPKQEEG